MKYTELMSVESIFRQLVMENSSVVLTMYILSTRNQTSAFDGSMVTALLPTHLTLIFYQFSHQKHILMEFPESS